VQHIGVTLNNHAGICKPVAILSLAACDRRISLIPWKSARQFARLFASQTAAIFTEGVRRRTARSQKRTSHSTGSEIPGSTFYNCSYRIGFPGGGHWNEMFKSDVYDQWFNPKAQGNPGGVNADGPAWDGMPSSAGITLRANSLIGFARDGGDF
jgi:hypothetical protein